MEENRKRLYVVDACVLIKWSLVEENDSLIALALRKDFFDEKLDLCVPSLAFHEVLNILALKKPEFYLIFLAELHALWLVQYELTLKVSSLALSIVRKIKGIALYDAIYHSLAMHLNATFITADERYYEKAKGLKHIMLLKDYK